MTTTTRANANASNVPLGSKYSAASPRPRRNVNDKTTISTRDNISAKVVAKPSAFKTQPRKQVADAPGQVDNVALAMGSTSVAFSRTNTGVNAPITANKAYQNAMRQGELNVGARRKHILQTGQIGTTASLNGGVKPTAGSPSGSEHATKKIFQNMNASTETGGVIVGGGRPASANVSTSSYRDPNDPRFVGAAGVPSGKMTGIAGFSNSVGDKRPISASKLRTNTGVDGAAGDKTSDREKRLDRFQRKGAHTDKIGTTHNNVIASSGPATEAQEAPLHTTKKMVAGRSAVSPYRSNATNGPSSAAGPQRTVSPMRSHVVAKPYATDDGAPASSPSATFARSVSATHQTQKSSLVGVFKPDTSLIQPRTNKAVAPWESKQTATVSQRGHVSAPASASQSSGPAAAGVPSGSNARKSNMEGVFVSADANKAPTGAAVGSSNIMGRVSPFRGQTASSPTIGAAGRTDASAATTSAVRRCRAGVVPPSQQGRDTRPVWAQTASSPTAAPQRPQSAARRPLGAASAPWATD